MLSILGAFVPVGTSVVGSCSTGYTMMIIRCWTGGGDVFAGAIGASIDITAFSPEVPILLAFVAMQRFLQVFAYYYPCVCDKDVFLKQPVGYLGRGTQQFDVCCHLVGRSEFGFLNLDGGGNGVWWEVHILLNLVNVVWVRWVEAAVARYEV